MNSGIGSALRALNGDDMLGREADNVETLKADSDAAGRLRRDLADLLKLERERRVIVFRIGKGVAFQVDQVADAKRADWDALHVCDVL
jgi:hypothetical protein